MTRHQLRVAALVFACAYATARAAEPPAETPDDDLIPVVRVEPKFPREALLKGISGRVKVEGTVGPDGSVVEVHVIESIPPGLYDDSALKAIKRWKFKPKLVDGVAIARPFVQTITYNLAGSPSGPALPPAPTYALPLLRESTAMRLAPRVAEAWRRDPAAVEAVFARLRAICTDAYATPAVGADALLPQAVSGGIPATLAAQPERVGESVADASRCLFTRVAHLADPEIYTAAAALFGPQIWDTAELAREFVALAPDPAAQGARNHPEAGQALQARILLAQRYYPLIIAAPLRAPPPPGKYVRERIGRAITKAHDAIDAQDYARARDELQALLAKTEEPYERAVLFQNIAAAELSAERHAESAEALQHALAERALPWVTESKICFNLLQIATLQDRADLFDSTLALIAERVVLPVGLRL